MNSSSRTLPDPPPQTPEARRRFALLRSLIYDEQRRHRWMLIVAALALLVVVALTVLARLYSVLDLDVWFTRELQERQWPMVTRLMYWVSIPGFAPWSAVIVTVASLLVGLLLGWRDGLFLLGITVAQGLLNALIKALIGRPRPVDSLVEVFVPVNGYSFPSGHVMFYTVFFGFALFLTLTRMPRTPLRWLAAVPLAALVLLVGPSRIILGAHWLSDVLAAYLLGFVILGLAIEGYLRFLAPESPAAEGGLLGVLDSEAETLRLRE